MYFNKNRREEDLKFLFRGLAINMSKRPRRSYLPKPEERERADFEMAKLASFHQALIDDERVRLKVAAHDALPDHEVPQVAVAIAAGIKQEKEDAVRLSTCDICMEDGQLKEWRFITWEKEGICYHGFCRVCAMKYAKILPLRITRPRGFWQCAKCPSCNRRVRFTFYAGEFDPETTL